MLTITTCWACNEPLHVTFVGQLSHPGCPQHEDERLARDFCDAVQQGDEPEIIRLERLLNAPKPEPKLGPSALWYARSGWPVFPLKPGEKVPATRNGFRDATRDSDKIREWWSSQEFNIGIPTGPETFDCIDIDGEAGMKSLLQLESDNHIPEVHGRVSTPRGLHLLIRGTTEGNRVGVRPGVDLRSIGGYVVCPPSIVNGRRYTWTVKPSPEILKV